MSKGALLAIFAAFIFSIMNVLVKIASATLPTAEIVFFRSSIGAFLVLLLMQQLPVRFSHKDFPLLVMRGLFGALYLLCYFYSIKHLPLSDASILAYLSPFFSLVLSLVVLREKISRSTALWLGLVIMGAVCVIRPDRYQSFNHAALIGVLSAFFAALAYLSVSKLSQRHHTYEIVFYFLAIATLVSLPLMLANFLWPNAHQWGLLLAIALVSLLGQIVLTQAFSSENLAVVAVVRYIGIIFNITWGWLFWDEVPALLSVMGGLLIIIACLRLSRQPASNTANRKNKKPTVPR